MALAWGNGCFVCGKENPDGLRLDFEVDEANRSIETSWVPAEAYQGYKGILHGGMVATLLDEVVGKLSTLIGMPAVTAEMTVRYVKPVPTGRPLRVRGRIIEDRRRLLLGESEAILEDGTVAATAALKLVKEKG
jgi:uncharacterized protein (TIGR00369 family)